MYIYIHINILYYISLTSEKEVVYFGLGEQNYPTETLPIKNLGLLCWLPSKVIHLPSCGWFPSPK